MVKYISSRIGQMLVTVVLVSFFTYILVDIMPKDPADQQRLVQVQRPVARFIFLLRDVGAVQGVDWVLGGRSPQ